MAMTVPSTAEIFKFITDDFESAWNAMVNRPGKHEGGGNFMFALLAMILLEFACRACKKAPSKAALTNFLNSLNRIEPRYFTTLPGSCKLPACFRSPGVSLNTQLLGFMFDMIRNGNAHQYHNVIAELSDGCFDIGIAGAASDREITPGRPRPKEHLQFELTNNNNIMIHLRPDQLYLDIKAAAHSSAIFNTSTTITDVSRHFSDPGSRYDLTVSKLRGELAKSGHVEIK